MPTCNDLQTLFVSTTIPEHDVFLCPSEKLGQCQIKLLENKYEQTLAEDFCSRQVLNPNMSKWVARVDKIILEVAWYGLFVFII